MASYVSLNPPYLPHTLDNIRFGFAQDGYNEVYHSG